MDQLRDSIGLRGYAQVDPLIAYKEESLKVFEGLMRAIDDEAINMILKIKIEPVQPVKPVTSNPLEYHGADTRAGEELLEEVEREEAEEEVEKPIVTKQKNKNSSDGISVTVRDVSKKMNQIVSEQSMVTDSSKIGRNDPCPCGSGKKFKKCCGK
jgi:preprotein translocase subunit SecA